MSQADVGITDTWVWSLPWPGGSPADDLQRGPVVGASQASQVEERADGGSQGRGTPLRVDRRAMGMHAPSSDGGWEGSPSPRATEVQP